MQHPVFAYCWLQARCKTEVIFSTCFSRSESTPPFVKCLHNRRLWNNSVLLLTVAAGDISHWPLTRAQAEFVSFTPCLQHMSGTVSPKPLCHMSAALSLCSSTSDAPTSCLIGGYRISTVLVFAYLWGQLKLLYQWSNFHQRQQNTVFHCCECDYHSLLEKHRQDNSNSRLRWQLFSQSVD